MSDIAKNIQKLLNEHTDATRKLKNEIQRMYEQDGTLESEDAYIFTIASKLEQTDALLKLVLKAVLQENFSSAETLQSLEKLNLLTTIDGKSEHGDQLTRLLKDVKQD